MKRNQVKIEWVANKSGFVKPGIATVIGKRPGYIPFVNIDNCDGQVVVSLDPREVESLIKKWKAAN